MELKHGSAFEKFEVIKYEKDDGGAIHYRVKIEVGKD
jgi:flavin-binding protein dodecin